jgi:hypothetical protein
VKGKKMHHIPESIVYTAFTFAYIATSLDLNKILVTLIFAAGYAVLATKKKK